MDIHDTKKNRNLNALLSHIAKKKVLAAEQKQHHIQQLTRQCNFEQNRTESTGENLTKLLPRINPENEPYLTHIERAIKCTKYHEPRQSPDNGYIIQILNTNKSRSAQKQIDRIQTPEILGNHECHYSVRRANNPDATTIHMIKTT